MQAESKIPPLTNLLEPGALEAYLSNGFIPLDTVEQAADCFDINHLVREDQPLYLPTLAQDWPCMQTWSFEAFAKHGRAHPARLEIGNVLQGEAQSRLSNIADYIRHDIHKEHTPQAVPYLSMLGIEAEFPALAKDLYFAPFRQKTAYSKVVAWLGPQGTVSGLHYDFFDNLFVQVSGRKEFIIASPVETPRLALSDKYDVGGFISQIDLQAFDADRFPHLKEARLSRVVLNPGDGLYLPRGWWHHVRSLDPSISTNCFRCGFNQLHLLLYGYCHGISHRLGIALPPLRF